jgi:iron complex outermembrane receptor protein
LYGQILVGTVLDNRTNKPLTSVRLHILESKRGMLSRTDGSFTLPLGERGTYTLRATLLGYMALEERIVATSLDTIRIRVRLQQAVVRLAAARVETSRITSENQPTQNATTISAQDLERSRGQTLGEALQNVAGVTLIQTGASIAKPVIRGLHSQRIVVVNAGVAQEGQQWGAEHAPEIDPFAPQRIEIVRGAAGVEYGAGAIGGVIRVLPHTLPRGAWFGGEGQTALFSNNSQGAVSLALEGGGLSLLPDTADTELHRFANGFGWRVQGSARKAGDSRAPSYVISNTGFQEINGSAAFGYESERFGVEAYYSLFTTELGIFSGSHIGNLNDLLRAIASGRPLVESEWTYAINAPRQQISHDLWSVKAHYDADFGRFEAQYGWQQNNRAEFDSHNARVHGDSGVLVQSLLRPAMSLQLTTYSLDAKFRHKALNIAPETVLTGVVGASGTAQWNVQSGRAFLIPSFQAQSGGAYLIETLAMPDFIANAGFRYDARHVSVVGSEFRNIPDTTQMFSSFSAALGVVMNFGLEINNNVSTETLTQQTAEEKTIDRPAFKPFSVALNLASAWRAPLVNEQFSEGVHHGTAQYEIGNPHLKPERSYSADATLTLRTEKVRFEVSGYVNAIDNFIYLRPDAANPTVTIRGTFPTFLYAQTLAFMRGVDASADALLSDNVRLGGTFSLVRGDNVTDSEPLIFMPADRLRAFIRYEAASLLGMADVFAEASSTLVRTQDRFPANVDYAPPPPGYVLFDCGFGGRVEVLGTRLSWNLSVRNVANTAYRDYLSRYRYFTDDAGRNVVVRVSVPFGDGR